MRIEIVRAKKNEFDKLAPLLKELWPKFRMNKKKLQPIYISQINSKDILLFAKLDGEAIGFISLSFRPDILRQGKVGLIEEFIVKENHRGKGIGRKLVSAIYKEAKKEGCVAVELYSDFKRTDAYKFYKKQGFEITAKFFWKKLK